MRSAAAYHIVVDTLWEVRVPDRIRQAQFRAQIVEDGAVEERSQLVDPLRLEQELVLNNTAPLACKTILCSPQESSSWSCRRSRRRTFAHA